MIKKYGTPYPFLINPGNGWSKESKVFFDKLTNTMFGDIKAYYADDEIRLKVPTEYKQIKGSYVFYDFSCPELSLVIEYHGSYWHKNTSKRDEAKQLLAENSGVKNYFQIWDYQAKDVKYMEVFNNKIQALVDDFKTI